MDAEFAQLQTTGKNSKLICCLFDGNVIMSKLLDMDGGEFQKTVNICYASEWISFVKDAEDISVLEGIVSVRLAGKDVFYTDDKKLAIQGYKMQYTDMRIL